MPKVFTCHAISIPFRTVWISRKMSYSKILQSRRREIGAWNILIALKLHRCQVACQISKRYENCNTQSRGFVTLRAITINRLITYWNGLQKLCIWTKCVPKGPNDNKSALVQVMAWHRTGAKPFPKPDLVYWLLYAALGADGLIYLALRRWLK